MITNPETKRAKLKQLLSGGHTQDQAVDMLGGSLQITLMEHKDTHTLVALNKGQNYVDVPNEKLQNFLDHTQRDNPGKRLAIRYIKREEYKAILAKLEEEY